MLLHLYTRICKFLGFFSWYFPYLPLPLLEAEEADDIDRPTLFCPDTTCRSPSFPCKTVSDALRSSGLSRWLRTALPFAPFTYLSSESAGNFGFRQVLTLLTLAPILKKMCEGCSMDVVVRASLFERAQKFE